MTILIAAVALLVSTTIVYAEVSVEYPPGSTITFPSADASFGPVIGNEFIGMLQVAEPLEGCTAIQAAPSSSYVALIQRSNPDNETCYFVTKVANAQAAGYGAVIVFDYINEGLVEMGGTPTSSIDIPAVFVSLSSGQYMLNATGQVIVTITSESLYTFYNFTNYFISVAVIIGTAMTLFAIFAICRRRAYVVQNIQQPYLGQPVLQPSQTIIFPVRVWSDADEPDTCCICLSEYVGNDKITVLPCKHMFHKDCIEPWLIERRRVCPICKRDPIPNESTPLVVVP